MNLLYVACVNVDDEKSGITRKVLSQYQSLNTCLPATLIGYWGKDAVLVKDDERKIVGAGLWHRRIAVIKMAGQMAGELKQPGVYIRRMPCNPLVIHMLHNLKREGCTKIIWEIPTYPYDYEFRGMRSVIVRVLDRHYRRILKNYVNRIVTFAPEDEIFGIPTIRTGNGIDVDSLRPRLIRKVDGTLRLLGVAVLNNWHGYDRLIRGLAEYRGSRKVFFHLVGNGPCLQEYQDLARELGVEDRVIFYGARNKAEIEDIYDECDMAVESLGWHRSQVQMGTSIKTREYVAKGMPILASTPMDIFPEGWKYAFYVPIDDSSVDIQGVVDFYDELLKTKTTEELADEIRHIAYEKCDMKKMMQPIVDYFKNM